MISILIVAITLILAIFASLLHRQRQQQQRCAAIRRTLDLLTALKSLLLLMQQHRGLTTGYLVGDKSLEASIRKVRDRIAEKMAAASRSQPALGEDPLFEGICNHWQRLQSHWNTQSVDNNVDQHNRLILNMLYLIENQACENPVLLAHSQRQGYHVIWKELLETIEAIGQTRAIGTSIVAAGETSAIDRVRLKFLMEQVDWRLKLLLKQFHRDLDHSVSEPDNYARRTIEEAQSQARILFAFIDKELIQSESIGISTAHFFDLASATITPLDKVYGHLSHTMATTLEA